MTQAPFTVGQSASQNRLQNACEPNIHPQNINDPNAATKFQEMAAASVFLTAEFHPQLNLFFPSYEILNDPHSRAVYDESGMDGLQGGGPGTGMDDLFAQFFNGGGGGFSFGFDMGGGGGRGGGPSRYAQKNDSVLQHEVTLEDLYNGKTVKMNMEKQVLCSSCKG